MVEKNSTFLKVGRVLVIVGILDICLMIWAISTQHGYSSSLNIFAVIAGILLIKGSIKTARIVRWFSAFFLTIIPVMLVSYPITTPFALLAIQIKTNITTILLTLPFTLLMIYFLYWVYKQLSNQESLAELSAAGYKTETPKSIYYISGVFFIFALALSFFMKHSETSDKAILLAKEQYGDNYQYHLSGFQLQGDHGSATIKAYNNNEVKNVNVKW